ncbi:hypothetical protein HPB50_012389 [Hyalomma asiaticum]|uniref:Uncharacterized protein n=1 Tax=Hyalomma asiaticum TaxID=266040 RepID=A0ACB7S2M6_HYAAI|nr:hypothetical protein HPB50_012389 [Hyalomma asiaticum]
MRTIKLLSSDGDVFPVSAAVAKVSLTIGAILEDLGIDDDEEEIIPLPNVTSATLKKIIEWADHHKDDSVPLQDDRLQKSTSAISSWDEEFLNVDRGTLFDIIRLIYYMI